MPSGAKKRKAAKKKKENQFTNLPSGSAHGYGDELKQQDDKDSDIGEGSSSASQDHHSQHNPLTDGEEEGTKKEGNVVVEDARVVNIDESNDKYEKSEHDESARNGGSSGSSSSSSRSSSDDESQGIKVTPVVEKVKADFSSETPSEAIHSSTIEEACVSAVETPVVDETPALIMKKAEADTSSTASHEVDFVSKDNGEEKPHPVEDKAGALVEPALERTEEIVIQSAENTASHEVDFVSKDNVEEKPHPVEDKTGSVVESTLERTEEMVIQSAENTAAVTDQRECVVSEIVERPTFPSSGPGHNIDDGAKFEKDNEVTKPLLEHPEKTSWKSCCGLCELFTGSAR